MGCSSLLKLLVGAAAAAACAAVLDTNAVDYTAKPEISFTATDAVFKPNPSPTDACTAIAEMRECEAACGQLERAGAAASFSTCGGTNEPPCARARARCFAVVSGDRACHWNVILRSPYTYTEPEPEPEPEPVTTTAEVCRVAAPAETPPAGPSEVAFPLGRRAAYEAHVAAAALDQEKLENEMFHVRVDLESTIAALEALPPTADFVTERAGVVQIYGYQRQACTDADTAITTEDECREACEYLYDAALADEDAPPKWFELNRDFGSPEYTGCHITRDYHSYFPVCFAHAEESNSGGTYDVSTNDKHLQTVCKGKDSASLEAYHATIAARQTELPPLQLQIDTVAANLALAKARLTAENDRLQGTFRSFVGQWKLQWQNYQVTTEQTQTVQIEWTESQQRGFVAGIDTTTFSTEHTDYSIMLASHNEGTASVQQTNSQSATREVSVEAGGGFGGFSASASATAENTEQWEETSSVEGTSGESEERTTSVGSERGRELAASLQEAVEKTFSTSGTTSFTETLSMRVTCGESHGDETLNVYQWVVVGTTLDGTTEITVPTDSFHCVGNENRKPLCPPELCGGEDCSCCTSADWLPDVTFPETGERLRDQIHTCNYKCPNDHDDQIAGVNIRDSVDELISTCTAAAIHGLCDGPGVGGAAPTDGVAQHVRDQCPCRCAEYGMAATTTTVSDQGTTPAGALVANGGTFVGVAGGVAAALLLVVLAVVVAMRHRKASNAPATLPYTTPASQQQQQQQQQQQHTPVTLTDNVLYEIVEQ